MKGLVLEEDYSISYKTDLPVPTVAEGSAIVKVIASTANSNFFQPRALTVATCLPNPSL